MRCNIGSCVAGSKLCVHATRNIAAGEALTISYADLLSPPVSQQASLLQGYGFLCRCQSCMDDAVPAVGRACLWTVRTQTPALERSGRGSSAPLWRLNPAEGPLQGMMGNPGDELGTGVTAGLADCCPAVREAAAVMHSVSQVLQTQDVKLPVLQALKRRLSVRP